MIFDILLNKIEAAGLAVRGKTLFRNLMPGETTVGVMFKDPLTGIDVDPNIPGWFKPKLQVIVRHTDPVEGRALAESVIKALIVTKPEYYPMSAEGRGRAHISVFYPAQLPIQFPLLDGGGIEWSLHFTTAFGFEPNWI